MLGLASAGVKNPANEHIAKPPRIRGNIVDFVFFTAPIQQLGFQQKHHITIFLPSLQFGNLNVRQGLSEQAGLGDLSAT